MNTHKHILFFDEYGESVRLEGERLVIQSEHRSARKYPLSELESVLFTQRGGSISLSALHTLLQRGIGVSLLDVKHCDLSSVSPRPTHMLHLNALQHGWCEDGTGLAIARRCIRDKIWHQKMIVLLMIQRARYQGLAQKSRQDISRCLDELKSEYRLIKTRVLSLKNYESELFQCEARAAKAYWLAIRCWLPRAHKFKGRRQKGDQPDPINSALNYAYAILSSRITHRLSALGFDPHIGCLHANRAHRASLTYDVMERYRQRYVDLPILRYALSAEPWSLDEEGKLSRDLRRIIAQRVLAALDPRSALGMSVIQEDLRRLRGSVLDQKHWQPLPLNRAGLSPI